jgi:hypothetical protein
VPDAEESLFQPVRRPTSAVFLALLWVVWVGAPVVLWFGAVMSLANFLGEPPTAADEQEALRWAIVGAVFAVGVPLLGLGLSLRGRRRVSATGFGGAVVVGLILSTAVVWPFWTTVHPAQPTVYERGGCQEHSGGDNRCPGG